MQDGNGQRDTAHAGGKRTSQRELETERVKDFLDLSMEVPPLQHHAIPAFDRHSVV
jgi:hypothetical protein